MPSLERDQSDAAPPSSSEADTPLDSIASHLIVGMPKPYYRRHDASEIRAHAKIIHRRADALVAVESCPGPLQVEFGERICVVTDDRPGLLSLLSAAISAHSLDILGARVYCRTRAGRGDEAVDLFSVCGLKAKAGSVLGSTEIASIRRTMECLLRGEIDVPELEKRAAQTSRPLGAPPVTVYFEDSRDADLLIVEAGDRPGLLLAISLTIFRERLTIVRSHVTTFAATARDEFELAEVDGSRLTGARRRGIAEKVREALSREKSLISSSSR